MKTTKTSHPGLRPRARFTALPAIAKATMLCALAVLTAHAHAALYHFSATVDLSSPDIRPGGADQFDIYSFTGVQPSFTLNAGDVVSGTITFANGLSLQVVDPDGSHFDYLGFSMFPQGSSSSNYSYTTHLLGVTGQLNGSSTKGSSGLLGNTVIGANFFDLTSSSVAFTGFDYSITLNANSGNNAYQPVEVYVNHAVTPVPEPGSVGVLFTFALGAVALLGRAPRLRRI